MSFTREGAEAFLRDLPKAEIHRLAAGHFAVEGNAGYIAANIKRFYGEKVGSRTKPKAGLPLSRDGKKAVHLPNTSVKTPSKGQSP